jgi:hypothetical protein
MLKLENILETEFYTPNINVLLFGEAALRPSFYSRIQIKCGNLMVINKLSSHFVNSFKLRRTLRGICALNQGVKHGPRAN